MSWLNKPINLTLFTLWGASLASYTLGEQMANSSWYAFGVALVFGLSLAKGWLVIDLFMGMRNAPRMWRRLLLGWLIGLILALAIVNLRA